MNRVSSITIEHDYLVMMNVDIKDFHMVGQHHVLAEALANLFSDAARGIVGFDVACYLLDN